MQNRLCETRNPVFDKIGVCGLDTYAHSGVPVYTLYNSDDYHFHDVLEIGMCTGGAGICCVNGVDYPYRAGSCQIVLPSVPHYTISTDEKLSEWKWLFIEPRDFADEEYIDILKNRIGVMGIFDSEREPRIADDVKSLIYELDLPLMAYKTETCRLQLKIMLLHLLRASEGSEPVKIEIPRMDTRISDAIKIMQADISRGVQRSVTEIAAEIGLSASHFRGHFKRTVGVSPKAYSERLAVRLAQDLLISTDLTISEIAFRAGFRDVSLLYRSFTALHGVSPQKYRRRWG